VSARTRKPADVVIVGLGAAGAIAASRLTEAGLSVVALEAGQRLGPADFPPDEIRNDVRNWLGRSKVNHEIPTARRHAGETATRPSLKNLMMNAVGGTKLHSTSQAYRLLPWNFESRSRTLERYGAGAIPPGSTLADWPLSYDELEPYYERVEDLFGISGAAGANVFEGPRRSPYPLPPMRSTGWTDLMRDAATELGWNPFPAPASIRTAEYRGLPACRYCGQCSLNGCWANAKGVASLSGLPEAEATGLLEVLTGAVALDIEVDGDGRASGVTFVSGSETWFQPARVVLLATYVYENVRLLLLSRSAAHPDGLANRHGQVGRHFMTHSITYSYGLFPGRDINGFSGTAAQATAIDDFNADNFDHRDLGFIGGSVLQASMEKKLLGFIRATPPGVPRWGSAWKAWLAENIRSVGYVWVQAEQLPYEDNVLDLDPEVRDPLGRPVIRATYDLHENERRMFAFLQDRIATWMRGAGATEVWHTPAQPIAVSTHAYGGTRMGTDPTTSVVDRWCMAHDVPNLGVLGASCFPTTGGANPTQTLEALAWRTADHIVEQWSTLGGA
jgi:gluconate 2-dehydrogenase alpha chain